MSNKKKFVKFKVIQDNHIIIPMIIAIDDISRIHPSPNGGYPMIMITKDGTKYLLDIDCQTAFEKIAEITRGTTSFD